MREVLIDNVCLREILLVLSSVSNLTVYFYLSTLRGGDESRGVELEDFWNAECRKSLQDTALLSSIILSVQSERYLKHAITLEIVMYRLSR